MASKGFTVNAILSCLPAYANDDDDITIIAGNDKRVVIPTLRQQLDDNGKPRLALADFINPAAPDSTPDDYIGIFAVSTGTPMQKLIDNIAATDEYRGLIYRTVADRLAEAATEASHRSALHDWGYDHAADNSDNGNGGNGDACQNQGANAVNLTDLDLDLHSIRPAVGYPSLPDQSLIFVLDDILDFSQVDMRPTDTGALNPPASTAGLIILNPQARYFVIGKIGDDQRTAYLNRHPLQRPDQARFLP